MIDIVTRLRHRSLRLLRLDSLSVVALVFAAGCAFTSQPESAPTPEPREITSRPEAVRSNQSTSSTRYFPPRTFDPNDRLSDSVDQWYSRHLRTMGEPSLSQGLATGVEAYRFLFLPTWGHPVAVRIERRREVSTITWRRLSGRGGYEPGTLALDESRRLTLEEWRRVEKELERIAFFGLPSRLPAAGADGAQFILEGARGGSYHLVDRWSPEPEDDFRQVCELIARLADPALLTMAARPTDPVEEQALERAVRGRFRAPTDADDESGEGTLDARIVVRMIQTRQAAFLACYERELRGDPALRGSIRMSLTIPESGAVENVRATEDSIGNAAVASCIAGVIERFRFTPGPEDGSVTFQFPFAFEPQD